MKKKFNSTPFVIIAVIILAVILVIVSSRNLNKPKDTEKTSEPKTEQSSLIDEIETIRIENTTDFDLIDIDRELDLL
jgi:large-conductance mechanosensitive channel